MSSINENLLTQKKDIVEVILKNLEKDEDILYENKLLKLFDNYLMTKQMKETLCDAVSSSYSMIYVLNVMTGRNKSPKEVLCSIIPESHRYFYLKHTNEEKIKVDSYFDEKFLQLAAQYFSQTGNKWFGCDYDYFMDTFNMSSNYETAFHFIFQKVCEEINLMFDCNVPVPKNEVYKIIKKKIKEFEDCFNVINIECSLDAII